MKQLVDMLAAMGRKEAMEFKQWVDEEIIPKLRTVNEDGTINKSQGVKKDGKC